MNMLIDLLPESVTLGGAEYPINTDFRVSILFEIMMQDSTVSDKQKIINALSLYYPNLPPTPFLKEAVDKILWFYKAGEEENKTRHGNEAGNEGETDEDNVADNKIKRAYSFEHDDDYIYSAFLSQYQIDLQDVPHLHWWKFRAMFKSLSENCLFSKIMSYRSMKISNKMTKEQKAFYRRMKSVYALPVPLEEREKTEAIINALKNGGNLTGLL